MIALSEILRGCDADDALEGAGKVTVIGESHRCGDFGNGQSTAAEIGCGALDAVFAEIIGEGGRGGRSCVG